ncbi:integrase family protein [Xylanimonas cellulosilytica DSM 15894]|uniref:Integrase family protein n=1 Tax=Xylanimonas cellulosilytica (strain DSM 15894 / JCM 12276 / CECT 5975 / KCTC 9989 / LMG 20990 / NBRC 107835 / XIL07) TaxID=446471 RepID=D1BXM3_XYLCX|nr:site-specific integrase [Xylanimonas cellulosilytica]ACZ29833.1 integrase family protein [Xylanimonas cellulosilytica DSM 15894]
MIRPRTPIGTFGEIEFTPLPGGSVRARVRYRDDDGRLRRVEAVGATRKSAEHALKGKLTRRASRVSGFGDLGPDSPFPALVDVWLEDLDLADRLAEGTRALYERNMRQLVMPAFENYTLREITVGRVDRFLKTLAKSKSHSMAKQAKTVLSLAFGLAVRYEAIGTNPLQGIDRLRKPERTTKALTVAEVRAIRAALREWRRGSGLPGPKPDGQLEAIVEVMLGTSARIGEVLAIRKRDVNVTTSPATVTISGTIVTPKGKSAYRQPNPKTQRSVRTMAVPSFTAEVIRARLVRLVHEDAEHLLFYSRNHTPLTPANVRRRLREALKSQGIEGVTPHAFRRTVATTVERAAGADLAAELLGHTSSSITKEHYIERDDHVDARTAEILEALGPAGVDDQSSGK